MTKSIVSNKENRNYKTHISELYKDLKPSLDNAGFAVMFYYPRRQKLAINIFRQESTKQYALQDVKLAEIEIFISSKNNTNDRILPSIIKKISYTPKNSEILKFEGYNKVIGLIFLFSKNNLQPLHEYFHDNLKLTQTRMENAILHNTLNRTLLELQLLQETGEKLSMSIKIEDVFTSIVKALKDLIPFDAIGIFILDNENDEIDEIYSDGYQRPDCKHLLEIKAGTGLVGWVIKTGEAVIVPDVNEDARYISARERTKSEIVVPLFSGNNVIGAFNIEADQFDVYSSLDLEIIQAFANQASISLTRAKLVEEVISKHKMEDELEIARQIQTSFLPDNFPRQKGYDLDAINISSKAVGGDYYDFWQIVDNQVGISIADVSGNGVPAALIMASFRASLIAEIRNNYAIRTIMRKVNNLICESVEKGNFVTAVYGVLDVKNNVFTFSNAGHNPPFVLRKDDSVEFLQDGGLMLGVLPDREYSERPLHIGKGDILILYTDGITETEDNNSEQFGTERLVELVQKYRTLSAIEIRKKIISEVNDFRGRNVEIDDLTIIIVKAD